jgi:acyl carrier protein
MNRQPATLENLEQRVIDLIVKHQRLHPGQVTIDSTFANLGIDSFDWKELLPEFEEVFDVSIPNDIAKYARSVRDVVAMLRKAVASPMPVA